MPTLEDLLNRALPLNRKERFYTGTVLPALICVDNFPDSLDNALALFTLHHKLFDLGAIGLNTSLRILISTAFSARTDAGRALYDLHGRNLQPRPGTPIPSADHLDWHRREVFKSQPLAA